MVGYDRGGSLGKQWEAEQERARGEGSKKVRNGRNRENMLFAWLDHVINFQ